MKWRVEDRGTRRRASTAYRWILDEEGRTVAILNRKLSAYSLSEEGDIETLKRYARLIARAPDLERAGQSLVWAAERLRVNFENAVKGIPVRDMAETLAEYEFALQQAKEAGLTVE